MKAAVSHMQDYSKMQTLTVSSDNGLVSFSPTFHCPAQSQGSRPNFTVFAVSWRLDQEDNIFWPIRWPWSPETGKLQSSLDTAAVLNNSIVEASLSAAAGHYMNPVMQGSFAR